MTAAFVASILKGSSLREAAEAGNRLAGWVAFSKACAEYISIVCRTLRGQNDRVAKKTISCQKSQC